MTSYLRRVDAPALEEFLRELGALRGMCANQTREVVADLCGLVACIVAEAVLQATEEMKEAVVVASFDVLDHQRAWIFETVRRQIASTQ